MTRRTILSSIRGSQLGLDKNGVPVDASNEVLNATSTGVNLKPYGISTIPATGAKTFRLEAPAPGYRKEIWTTSTSTAARTVTLVSGGMQSSTGTTAFDTIVFRGVGQGIMLTGLTTALYQITYHNSTAALA